MEEERSTVSPHVRTYLQKSARRFIRGWWREGGEDGVDGVATTTVAVVAVTG